MVWDVNQSQVAEVQSIHGAGAVLKRDRRSPLKKKPLAVAKLVVMPCPDPHCKPVCAGQTVVVNAGSNANLIGQLGVIQNFNTQLRTVALQGQKPIQVCTKYLHALDGKGVQPTVPLAPVTRVPVKKFWSWLQDYKKANEVELIGLTKERYEAILADFTRITRL